MDDNGIGKVVITAEERENYGAVVSLGKSKKIHCYSKSQMKAIYPRGNYKLNGECIVNRGGRTRAKGTFNIAGEELPLYKLHTYNRLVNRVKGYAACKDYPNRYVVILKDMLIPYLLILVLAVSMLAGGYVYYRNTGKPVIAKNPSLDPNAVEWKGSLPEPSGGVTEGIRIPGYKSITIAANKKDVKVNFVNPEQNKCYFVISLILSDNGEVLYKSKMVEPGKGFYNITLARALKPGTYAAKVKYDTYSMDGNLSPLNGAVVNIDLIAK